MDPRHLETVGRHESPDGLRSAFSGLSLAWQFLLLGSALVLLSLGILGYWVSTKIEQIVVDDVSRRAASYVHEIIEPNLRGVPLDWPLPKNVIDALNRSTDIDPVGMGVEQLKIWSLDGAILYDTFSTSTPFAHEPTDHVLAAAAGETVVVFEEWLHEDPSKNDSAKTNGDSDKTLLETYVPIRREGSNLVVAVAEFYQSAQLVRSQLRSALTQTWAVTGMVSFGLIGGLLSVVVRGSRLIEVQRAALDRRVEDLTELLSHNEHLRRSVISATQLSAKDTEAHLRSIGSDLHDGVGQLIAIAQLKLNDLFDGDVSKADEYSSVKEVLGEAMAEVRAMAAGLALPEIESLSTRDAIALIVSRHERRTRTEVSFSHFGDAVELSQPLKLCACRFVQETLNNALRHAGGRDQNVSMNCRYGVMSITVSDGGPGIEATVTGGKRQRLGLIGLRNRLESLGGSLEVTSRAGGGTAVTATLVLEQDERA